MTAPSQPSALPAADALPHALLRAGLIPPGRYLEAVAAVRDEARWRRWGQAALLAVAVAQILTAVVFFFAFNWAALPPFAKLGLIQAAIVLCVAGAWLGRRRPAAWEALLTAAAVLVGVLLAVFGQIYQTGADAWTLFAGWAALILPWATLTRALAPWVLWLAVAGLGGAAYAGQIAIPMEWIRAEAVAILLALFYLAVLALHEVAGSRGATRLRAAWLRRLLVAVILAITFSAAAPAVFDDAPDVHGWLALSAFAFAAAGLGAAGCWRGDLPVVALAVLAASLLLTLGGLRIAFETGDAVGGSLLLLAVVAAVFGAALSLLHRVRAWMAGAAGDG